MRRLVYGALLVLMILALPVFGATTYPCADNTTSCDPYAADEETESWMAGTVKPPTPETCYAIGSKGQGCWGCIEQYEGPQPTGKMFCGLVRKSGSCTCQGYGTYCSMMGDCTYRWL